MQGITLGKDMNHCVWHTERVFELGGKCIFFLYALRSKIFHQTDVQFTYITLFM